MFHYIPQVPGYRWTVLLLIPPLLTSKYHPGLENLSKEVFHHFSLYVLIFFPISVFPDDKEF